ncbi:hypothetical protein [Thomasclavelia cocleata]|uniref:hypothetical protein n=1 Tax=Thomasclavelia cocleata TaxID=69824 RepID=UPI0032E8784C
MTEDGRVIYVEEVRTERLAKNIKVYSLEIKELHNYYASEILVHNGCKIGENGTQTTSYNCWKKWANRKN